MIESGDIEALLDRFEPALARAWRTTVRESQKELENDDEFRRLVALGLFDQAADRASEFLSRFANAPARVFVQSGETLAARIVERGIAPKGRRKKPVVLSFDQTVRSAVETMRENRLSLVREISTDTRETFRQVLLRGLGEGINPRDTSRQLIDGLGLTARQEQIVDNYRRQLESLEVGGIKARALHDRRFDRTIDSAVARDRSLTRNQINRMAANYRRRWVAYRAEVISRTETLRTVHQANREAVNQLIATAQIGPDELEQVWFTARDQRRRESHRSMEGQRRTAGAPFTSGDGFSLRFPGDPRAPASEVIQCRCSVGTRPRR